MTPIKTIKQPLLSSHGTYMYGKLDELDFTTSWKNDQGQTMPNMLKLKFIVTKPATKMLLGIEKIYNKTVFEYLNIQCDSEEELSSKYDSFLQYKDKEILVPIENTKEKTTYKINENNLQIIDSKTS
ncbi:hypothetical protein KO488_08340 [Poseidonibacter lekithochrous]|uniref:hypothetical protein n=1 Tax=Poseidonibacter TaxID=2321187 RepID=UPI001C092DB1|nr:MULTISPECIES: hypothetical protein [Poseidonibacter]MBU3014763.1 hypothetical protein [Poseidonibacter lekithochrous]MDO6828061.1 hypothetical protein [Poseidonibacter sp. 1_MG-2023]